MTAQVITNPTTRPGRALGITLWALQITLAALFIFVSIPKLIGDPAVLEGFATIGLGASFILFTGVVELAGGIGLLIPRLSGLASAGLALTMVGATVVNLLIPGMAAAAILTSVLCAVFCFISWSRRSQTAALLNRFKR